ncbi:MAG: FeoA family protein [Planctomycetota bacterium]
MSPATPSTDVRLTQLARGATGSVTSHAFEGGASGRDSETLRAMGLGPEALVTVRRIGEPCVVEVRRACDCSGGHCSRIGLARRLADRIVVRPR